MDKYRRYGMAVLLGLSFFVLLGYLLMTYQHQDTLQIGIFSGSNWNVPGTEHYDLFHTAIEKFQQKHPNIKIVYEEGIPAKYYSEWLSGEILKGTEPDVFLVLQEDLQALIKTGALATLDKEILADDSFDPSIFYESAYNAGQKNHLQYAIPFECNPRMMFVNKTLLKKEGIALPDASWTWDDFLEVCRKVTKDTDGDGEIDQYGFYDYTWLDAAYANNIVPFSEDGRDSNFSDRKMINAISYVKKLNETAENYVVTSNDFDLGKVAFRPLSFADYRTYMPYPWRIKKYSGFEWNCVTMPAGTNGRNASSMDTLMMGMSNRTRNKKMAWEFLKMVTTDPDIQKYIYIDTPGASALKETTSSMEVMKILNEDTPGGSEIDMTLLDQIIAQAIIPDYFDDYEAALQYADHIIREAISTEEELNLALFQLKNELKRIMNQ